MSHLQWFDYLRMCTATLAFVALYLSARRARKGWESYTVRLKELWWAMNALLVLMVEGSLEQVAQNAKWGPRTLLSFLVAVICVKAQLRREGYTKTE